MNNVHSSFNFVAPKVNRFNTRSTDNPKQDLLKNSIKFAEEYFKCSHNNGKDFMRLCLVIKDGENISYNTNKSTIYVGLESIDVHNFELINSLFHNKDDILELSKNESILFPKNFTRGFMQLLAFGAIRYLMENNQRSYQNLSIKNILQVIADAFLEYKGKVIQYSMCQGTNSINVRNYPGYYIQLAREYYYKEIKEILSSTYLNDINVAHYNRDPVTLKFAKKHYDNFTVSIPNNFFFHSNKSYLTALSLINNISKDQLDGNITNILTQILESLNDDKKAFSILFAISILGQDANKETVCSFIKSYTNLKISENDIPKIQLGQCTDSRLTVKIGNSLIWSYLPNLKKSIIDKNNVLQTTSL